MFVTEMDYQFVCVSSPRCQLCLLGLISLPPLWLLNNDNYSFNGQLKQSFLKDGKPLSRITFIWINKIAHQSYSSNFEYKIYLSSTILICLWRFAFKSLRVYNGCGGGGAGGAGGGTPAGGARLPMSTRNSAINVCTITYEHDQTPPRYTHLWRTSLNQPASTCQVPLAR